jgi:hypothetical protein
MQIVHPAPIERAELIDFFNAVLPAKGEFCTWAKATKRHQWATSHQSLADLLLTQAGTADIYYATAAFDAKQRKQNHVAGKRALYLDIDAGPDKHSRDPQGTYADQRAGAEAIKAFVGATGLLPTFIIDSGTGLHLYWALTADLPPADWLPLAQALKAACTEHGLRADPACTADSARLLRPLGALHSNGRRVRLLKSTGKTWTLEALRERLAAAVKSAAPAAAVPALSAPPARAKLDVNASLAPALGFPRNEQSERVVTSALTAIAAHYSASGTYPRPDWLEVMLALASLDAAEGWRGRGEELALEHSRATPGYVDDASVLQALKSYDANREPKVTIGSLRHRAQALGWVRPADVVAVAADGAAGAPVPPWLAEMNARYAVVRWGAGVVILDEQTPTQTPAGVRHAPGFLDAAAFRAMLRGRVVVVGDRPTSLAEAWLHSRQRRQYEAAVFAPDEALPDNVLNLWNGFAFDPQPGDVQPWLDLLDALVADRAVRDYLLRWLAWKVQRPGGVPGTILVLTGSKGAGKNALFDPVLRIFGQHGRLFDDSEQVAGRFTGHLMDVALAVLDEALFVGDPKAADRIKARVTASTMTFEARGRDPVQGVNRCAYVSLSNHSHVWQSTIDERRAVVVESSNKLIGAFDFWDTYWRWATGDGPSALLDHLQKIDLRKFDVRRIPKSDALRRQVELTSLRDPAISWWAGVLAEGGLTVKDGGLSHFVALEEDVETAVPRRELRLSFEGGGRHRPGDFDAAMRRLRTWHSFSDRNRREGSTRLQETVLPPLTELKRQFAEATGVRIDAADGRV